RARRAARLAAAGCAGVRSRPSKLAGMWRVTGRRGRAARVAARDERRGSETRSRAGARRSSGPRHRPLEQRMLLTATLCLLAYGAVMVYSASSATSLLQGHGSGSGYLLKYLLYGAVGLLLMRLLAADGV